MRHGLTWEYFTFNGTDYKRRMVCETNGSQTIQWLKYVEIAYSKDDLSVIKDWKWVSFDEKSELEQMYEEFIFNEDRVKKLNRIIDDRI